MDSPFEVLAVSLNTSKMPENQYGSAAAEVHSETRMGNQSDKGQGGTSQYVAFRQRMGSFARSADGVSALEFGIIAPLLIFSILSMTDIGLALYDRMTLDHVLRAGAQAALEDPGSVVVNTVLDATAARSFDITSFSMDATRYCSCDSGTTLLDCTTVTSCSGGIPLQIFYDMAATKTYDGIFIPQIQLASTLQVQVQ